MKDKLEIIAIFKKRIICKNSFDLLDLNIDNNSIDNNNIDDNIDNNNIDNERRVGLRVSYKLSEVIRFDRKLKSCLRYRTLVFNNLNELIKQNSSNDRNDENSRTHSKIIEILVKLKQMEPLFVDKFWFVF
jgi:hypothetical protein